MPKLIRLTMALVITLILSGVATAQLSTSEKWGNINVNLTYYVNVSNWTITLNFAVTDTTNDTAWYNITFPSGFNASNAIVEAKINGEDLGILPNESANWTVYNGTSYVNVSSTNVSVAIAYNNTLQYINISNVIIPNEIANTDKEYTIQLETNATNGTKINLTIIVKLAEAIPTDTPPDYVSPGEKYIAFNITYTDNESILNGTILKWFNATINNSVTNPISPLNISNVTVLCDGNILGWDDNATDGINVSLKDYQVQNGSTCNLTVEITLSNNVTDGTNVSLNATLVVVAMDNSSVNRSYVVNDPSPETVSIQGIIVTATPPTIGVGIYDKIVVKVTDLANNPLSNAIVNVTTPDEKLYTNTTNSSGIATFEIITNVSGYVEINATYINASNGLLTNNTTIEAIKVVYITDYDYPKYVNPGSEYVAYNVSIRAPSSNIVIYWYNATLNESIPNVVSPDYITNVTLINSSGIIIGFDNNVSDGINISLGVTVQGNTYYNFSVYVKLSNNVPDGKNISFNATLMIKSVNATNYSYLSANDPYPETVSITAIKVIAPSSITTVGEPMTIRIKVTDPSGNPLEGSAVTISGCGVHLTKATDSNGIADFRVILKYGGTIQVKATYVNSAGSTLTALSYIKVYYRVIGGGGGGYVITPTPTTTFTPSPTTTVEKPKATPTLMPTPTPTTPTPTPTTPTPTPTTPTPGFEVIFAIAGLLAIAYLLRREQ